MLTVYMNLLMKPPSKNAKIFECKSCDFSSRKESEYTRHLATGKHKRLTNIENDNKNAKIFTCELCSKHYF